MELIVVHPPRVLPYRAAYHLAKRVLDLFLCLVTLPLTLPLMGLCAIAVRLDSPGPALFVQERIGKDGRPFKMYKFRTMQHNLDDTMHRAFMKAFVHGEIGADGGTRAYDKAFRRAFAIHPARASEPGNHIYKPITDSQVTRVGRFLRKTSLDELPQIFNVIRGEMSLVGPRPNVPWEVEEYKPWHHERLEVLPGITGLAQVRGRSGISFDTIVKYDIEYVENQSLSLDLKILLWTVGAVLSGRGSS